MSRFSLGVEEATRRYVEERRRLDEEEPAREASRPVGPRSPVERRPDGMIVDVEPPKRRWDEIRVSTAGLKPMETGPILYALKIVCASLASVPIWFFDWTSAGASWMKTHRFGWVSHETYNRRTRVCNGCEHAYYDVASRGLFCGFRGGCGCGHWRGAAIDEKNKLSGWVCPAGKFGKGNHDVGLSITLDRMNDSDERKRNGE